MMIVFFNGPSVNRYVDLYLDNHTTIGCNWMFERVDLNHCVCLDWQMQTHIDHRYPTLPESTKFWCQSGFQRPGWHPISYPLTEQPQNSGLLALTLAVQLRPNHIYVLGCDWGRSNQSVFDYGDRTSPHKYTNHSLALVRTLNQRVPITFVSDQTIDVPTQIMGSSAFIDRILSL